jgi:hemerythrin-like metal-binding protein
MIAPKRQPRDIDKAAETMAWILWDNTLETGHSRMDADHRELSRLFNLLREAVEQHRGKEFCSLVLEQIIEHARSHFQREQQLMARRHYPRTEQHAAEHAMLLDQAVNYKAAFDLAESEPDIDLVNFPEVWLAFHILFSDKDLARFLAQAK